MKGNTIANLIFISLISIILAYFANRINLYENSINPSSKHESCVLPYIFTDKYHRDQMDFNKGENYLQSYNFLENGWISMDICHKGILKFVASGESAEGYPPVLHVILNSKIIWTGEFIKEREVEIEIPSPGNLVLGYFNDYYKSDYRDAHIRKIRLNSTKCSDISMTAPPQAGNSWRAGSDAIWIFSPPVTINPCDKGEITFEVHGRKGNGSFAVLSVGENGRELRRINVNSDVQSISLSISGSPLEITILNPYARKVSDRNLFLREILFTPYGD